MTYYYNHFRKPKLGNFLKVRDLAIESRAKMPNPGFVTATISHPQPALGSNIIVSTTIFDSAEEMDKVLDYSDTNDEILERIQEVTPYVNPLLLLLDRSFITPAFLRGLHPRYV